MMKLAALNLLFPFFYSSAVSANQPTAGVRGLGDQVLNNNKNDDGWVQDPTDSRRRRRKLEIESSDCLLVLKAIDYENHEGDNDVWACAFSHDFAEEQLHGHEFMEIDPTLKDDIDELQPVSGASILKTRDAFVEQSLDTSEMTLHIPEDGKIEVEILDESHERHYKQRRRKMKQQQRALRSLADSGPGELSTLVIRVVDSNGSAGPSEAQLNDDIFVDSFSLKTGYAQCSHDQLIIKPATGNSKIVNGIATINIDVAASSGSNSLESAAFQKASAEFGALSDQWDLVMFCQPPSGTWLAYAYINSWVSFYNGKWCSSASAQMHEVGHNLGLGHSNEPAQSYGDQSGLMGFSYDSDDGPRMCFNAAKNFQLGWYERQKLGFYPLSNRNSVQNFVLNGVQQYKKSGNTDGKLITLRIAEFGDSGGGRDYYVGFNDVFGANSETIEGRNQVLIFRKESGGPNAYGESDRIGALNVGNSFTISNFGNEEDVDVTIRFNSLTNSGRDANIEIATSGSGDGPTPQSPVAQPTQTPTTRPPVRAPTEAPTVFDDMSMDCGGIGRFQFELTTDMYAFETAWQLIDNDTNSVIENVSKENHYSDATYLYPRDDPNVQIDATNNYYCLEQGKCYTMKLTDTFSDGLNYGEGFYKGYLDDQVEFVGDGNFGSEIDHVFCVDGSVPTPTQIPSNPPTDPPTNRLTSQPTSPPLPTVAPTIGNNNDDQETNPPTSTCPKNSQDVVFKNAKGKKKKCSWVKVGNLKQIRNKCNKSYKGIKVKKACPRACAIFGGVGPCKSLYFEASRK